MQTDLITKVYFNEHLTHSCVGMPQGLQALLSSYTPCLNYGTILWGAAYRYRLNKLEKIQKRCIRSVYNATYMYNAHTDPLVRKLTVPKLLDMHKIQLCKYMFSSCVSAVADTFTHNVSL